MNFDPYLSSTATIESTHSAVRAFIAQHDAHQIDEYLNLRGHYADTPIAAITQTFQEHYAMLLNETETADFDQDVALEVNQ